jgi:hypothetical protein
MTMSTLTLTRDEAVAVAEQLEMTCGDFLDIPGDASTSEGSWAAIRRLTLEATIRDTCGWWGTADPRHLDSLRQFGRGDCPARFALTPEAGAALAELLPEIIAELGIRISDDVAFSVHEEIIVGAEARLTALEGLAARLGVEIPVTATP